MLGTETPLRGWHHSHTVIHNKILSPAIASTSLSRSFLISKGIGSGRFWMFLSGNAEGALPSRTATNAAAMSLPPPAITAATSPVNAAAVVASVMSTLTTTVLVVYLIYSG
jgi:hypothetical protein